MGLMAVSLSALQRESNGAQHNCSFAVNDGVHARGESGATGGCFVKIFGKLISQSKR